MKTKHDMAALRANQQKYDLAVKLFEEVYKMRRSVLGKNHPVRSCFGDFKDGRLI